MEVRNLITFVTVADCGSFTKASGRLNMSQPTVSTHIKLLEEELGISLLKRSSKSVELTGHGRNLYQDAKRIIALNNKILENINGGAILRIGASTIPATYILPDYLKIFTASEKSEVNIDSLFIKQADSAQIVRDVTDGIIDVGFIGMSCSIANITVVPIATDKMVFIAPNTEKYRKLQQKGFTVSDLKYERFILREDGSGSLNYMQNLFEEYGLGIESLKIVGNVSSHETIKCMVSAGIGISFISELSAIDYIESGKCLAVNIPLFDTTRQMNMIYRSDVAQNQLAQKFINFVGSI